MKYAFVQATLKWTAAEATEEGGPSKITAQILALGSAAAVVKAFKKCFSRVEAVSYAQSQIIN